MRSHARILAACLIALVLGTQWLAHAHRVQHGAGNLQHVVTPTTPSNDWGHDAESAACTLFDALTGAAGLLDDAQPLVSLLHSAHVFLLVYCACVALRALRATARAPPDLN